MLSRQEIFDTALSGIRGQNGFSVDENGVCLYRGPDGKKCAAGWLIPDSKYNIEIEGQNAFGLTDFFEGCGVSYDDMVFLAQLQSIHDSCSEDGSLSTWETKMKLCADRNFLTYQTP